MLAYRKWIGRLLYIPGALAIAAAAAYRYRIEYEITDTPRQPWIPTGNTVPWASHGAIHYITAEQAHSLALSVQVITLAAVAFVAGIILEWGWNMFRRDR